MQFFLLLWSNRIFRNSVSCKRRVEIIQVRSLIALFQTRLVKFPGRMLVLCAYQRLADVVHSLGNILCTDSDPSSLVSVVVWGSHHVWKTSEQPKVVEENIPCNHFCSVIGIPLLWIISEFQWVNRLPNVAPPSFSPKPYPPQNLSGAVKADEYLLKEQN